MTTTTGTMRVDVVATVNEALAYELIHEHRERQRVRWENDDELSAGEWLAILVTELGKVAEAQKGRSARVLEDELASLGAVTVAMLEELANV